MTAIALHIRDRQAGFSLVELLVAVTVGLLILTGLSLVFVNSSQANRELQLAGQQIENGRYATDLLTQNLRLAGFYGHMHKLPAPGAEPDPCDVAIANLNTSIKAALSYPMQAYTAANAASTPFAAIAAGTTCDDIGLLTAANLQPGSDVMVIRRADSLPFADVSTSPYSVKEAIKTGEVYIQATNAVADLQIGVAGADPDLHKADAANTVLKTKDNKPAPVRKYHVHVYFVAPCSKGSGANGVCQAGDDTVPALKRLELTRNAAGTALIMNLVPLVEGIEALKIAYGVDNEPDVVDSKTGSKGDGVVDVYKASPSLAEWPIVVATKIHILARNTLTSADHTDTKTYTLGIDSVGAPYTITPGGRFKRHVFTSTVRLVNVGGRREIP